MKYTVPIIVSLACVAVQALPIPDDHDSNDAGVDDLLDDANTIIGGPGNDVGNFLGSLADRVVARSKRDLLDDVSQAKSKRAELLTVPLLDIDVEPLISLDNDEDIKENVPLQLNGKAKRSPIEENEEASDCADAEDTPAFPDNSALDDDSTSENPSDTANSADGIISGDFDDGGLNEDSSLTDDSSLTSNEIENGVSAEAGDQTDLSRRTVLPNVGSVLGDIPIGSGLLDIDVGQVGDSVLA